MSLADSLEALSAKAGIERRAAAMEHLRADFALVWQAERRYLTTVELESFAADRERAGQYIRSHMGDAQVMQAIATMYKGMADQIRHEQARDERIRGEVRAERMKGAA